MGQTGKHLELHLRFLSEGNITNIIKTGKIISAFIDFHFSFPFSCTFEFVIVMYTWLMSDFKTEMWETWWYAYLISCSVIGELYVFGYGYCMAKGYFPAFLPCDWLWAKIGTTARHNPLCTLLFHLMWMDIQLML